MDKHGEARVRKRKSLDQNWAVMEEQGEVLQRMALYRKSKAKYCNAAEK